MYRSLCILALCALSGSVFQCAAETTEDPKTGAYGIFEPTDPVEEACKAQHNIPKDTLNSLYANAVTLINHPETRCYAACLLIGRKSLNADGTLNISQVNKGLPRNIADRDAVIAAFHSCANKEGADICEKAYNTITCINSQEAITNMHPSN